MNKIFVFSFALIGLSINVNAQDNYPKGFRLGFGLNGGFPTDSAYDGSLGVDARLQYDFSKTSSMTLTSGYTHLFNSPTDQGYVPAKLGYKYFVGKNLYILGEVGAAFGVSDNLDNTMIIAPAIGFANKYIDASLRYEHLNDYETNQIAVRLAYGFSLKKKK